GLAVVAGALRALALRDGERPAAPLKAMVPVSMRRPDELGPGNRIAMVYVALPVHLGAPQERLAWVREQTRRLKHGDRAAPPHPPPATPVLPALLEAALHARADTPPTPPAPDTRGRNDAAIRNLSVAR